MKLALALAHDTTANSTSSKPPGFHDMAPSSVFGKQCHVMYCLHAPRTIPNNPCTCKRAPDAATWASLLCGNDSPQAGPPYRAVRTGFLEWALLLGCMDGPHVPHNTGTTPGRVPWKGLDGPLPNNNQPPLGGTFAGANETGPWPSHRTQPQTATCSKPPGFQDMAPSSDSIAIRGTAWKAHACAHCRSRLCSPTSQGAHTRTNTVKILLHITLMGATHICGRLAIKWRWMCALCVCPMFPMHAARGTLSYFSWQRQPTARARMSRTTPAQHRPAWKGSLEGALPLGWMGPHRTTTSPLGWHIRRGE